MMAVALWMFFFFFTVRGVGQKHSKHQGDKRLLSVCDSIQDYSKFTAEEEQDH